LNAFIIFNECYWAGVFKKYEMGRECSTQETSYISLMHGTELYFTGYFPIEAINSSTIHRTGYQKLCYVSTRGLSSH